VRLVRLAIEQSVGDLRPGPKLWVAVVQLERKYGHAVGVVRPFWTTTLLVRFSPFSQEQGNCLITVAPLYICSNRLSGFECRGASRHGRLSTTAQIALNAPHASEEQLKTLNARVGSMQKLWRVFRTLIQWRAIL